MMCQNKIYMNEVRHGQSLLHKNHTENAEEQIYSYLKTNMLESC